MRSSFLKEVRDDTALEVRRISHRAKRATKRGSAGPATMTNHVGPRSAARFSRRVHAALRDYESFFISQRRAISPYDSKQAQKTLF